MASKRQKSPHLLLAYLCSPETLFDALGVVGVTATLLLYGILQERIVTIGFGARKEIFEHSIFLVLCNRLVTCVLALLYMAATRTPVYPAAPLQTYATVSLTNVIATSCQYEALHFVSFSVQTLAKSAKALPVMIWGTFYNPRRYKLGDYAHALTITAGCCVFLLTGPVASRTVANKADAFHYIVGAVLMLLYLGVDGLTSTCQDRMFTGYQVGVCDQVLYTTAFSTLLSLVGAVAAHQLVPALRFLLRNPDAGGWILALSAISAVVQLVISWTIKRYGAVVFATIMTTRQFFSILLSSLVFVTPLTLGQWVGSAVVFAAIYAKTAQRLRAASSASAALPKYEALYGSERLAEHEQRDVTAPLLDKRYAGSTATAHMLLQATSSAALTGTLHSLPHTLPKSLGGMRADEDPDNAVHEA